jgi:tetratricopeptide (TPR) repeat protein
MFLMEYQLQAPSILGGDKTKARAIPERIMRVNPVEGHFALVRVARFDRHYDRIEGIYRQAVQVRPSNYDARVQLGNFCAANKKFEEADQHAREAIRIDADRVDAHSLLAAVLAQQKKWAELDRALAEAEKAIPDNLAPRYRAAANCLGLNVEPVRAEQYIRQYLGQEPEPNMPSHAEARWRLGRALEMQGRKAEAIAEYRAALKMDANSPAKQDLKRLK